MCIIRNTRNTNFSIRCDTMVCVLFCPQHCRNVTTRKEQTNMNELSPLCQQLERIADMLEQIADTLGRIEDALGEQMENNE